MIMFHLKTQIVQVKIKFQKNHKMNLINLEVSKARVSVLIFKNMKLMKTIFKMKSLQSHPFKKLKRLNKKLNKQ